MKKTKFPGWRHMTAAQRYNARMHDLFERNMALHYGKNWREQQQEGEVCPSAINRSGGAAQVKGGGE